MSNSLRDQLLKAGLIPQKQVEKAKTHPQKPVNPAPPKEKQADRRVKNPQQHRTSTPANPPVRKEQSDLEQFYKARNEIERAERAEEERRQRETAARRKQVREQTRALISENLKNVDDADIRYNFVISDNIKYLYVTEQQQAELADGTLAITFMDGKRCLISAQIAQQLRELDPDKIVIINQPEAADSTDI
jgi:hypothetical protein